MVANSFTCESYFINFFYFDGLFIALFSFIDFAFKITSKYWISKKIFLDVIFSLSELFLHVKKRAEIVFKENGYYCQLSTKYGCLWLSFSTYTFLVNKFSLQQIRKLDTVQWFAAYIFFCCFLLFVNTFINLVNMYIM